MYLHPSTHACRTATRTFQTPGTTGSGVPAKWVALDSFSFFAHFLWNHAIIMAMAGFNSKAIIAIIIAHMEIRRALRELDKLSSARASARSDSFRG